MLAEWIHCSILSVIWTGRSLQVKGQLPVQALGTKNVEDRTEVRDKKIRTWERREKYQRTYWGLNPWLPVQNYFTVCNAMPLQSEEWIHFLRLPISQPRLSVFTEFPLNITTHHLPQDGINTIRTVPFIVVHEGSSMWLFSAVASHNTSINAYENNTFITSLFFKPHGKFHSGKQRLVNKVATHSTHS